MWVVDSADRRRLEDCKRELHTLLVEEVGGLLYFSFGGGRGGDERENVSCGGGG